MKNQSLRAFLLSGILLVSSLAGCSANVKNEANDGAQTNAVNYKNEAYADAAYENMAPEEVDPEWNTEEYKFLSENSFQSVTANPFATFAADVDTASYSNFRRQIENGQNMQPDSVRVEEFINYFHYDYPEPEGDETFSITTEIAPCPWNEKTQLLSVGLQTKCLNAENLPRSNLVFLIDVSGSMDNANKLPLVQRSFLTLVETLDQNDTVSIITYSSGESIILDGANGSQQQKIAAAIEGLVAHGATQGDKAIQMAYEIAESHFIEDGINRVIMATDGDFNVGITSESELTRLIQEKAKSGVYLSVLGYGMGNYKDNKLESMADHGNGNYAYIDTIDEARRVLVKEAGGTLFTVAKDVKLQLEFNPMVIKGYRLIGYENRVMSATDFSDDTKDGGEIGAGHQVTALFEIVPVDSDFEIPSVDSKYGKTETGSNEFADEICSLNIRYKLPNGTESVLKNCPVTKDSFRDTMSENLSWAAGVAEVAMLLKGSAYKGTSSLEGAKDLLTPAANDDFRREFLELISKIK